MIDSKDLNLIKAILNLNFDLNIQNDSGSTILHELCKEPKSPIDLIELVMTKSKNNTLKDKDGNTALMIVA